MMAPRVLIPFIVVTLIWGSTWIVIKDQLGAVPPTWSVAYRFTAAAAAMFFYALWKGVPLRIGRRGHLFALSFGLPQFFLNFNLVYAAEHYITSGLCAVLFALLLVPNSALGWLFLKHRITPRFLAGSAIATAGVALLFVQEMRSTALAPGAVLLGIGLTLAAVLSASVANILQATERARSMPVEGALAWGMAYGVAANILLALILYGPPAIEYRAGYWAGVLYLGLVASALAFPLYFGVIRAVGPGKAAYSSLLVPIIAMGFSTVLEGYHWSPLAVAGGVLALVGLFVALKARRPNPVPIAD
ncbi:DMT family transporter [Allosphingosinicella indica]|uniref:EamA-like transporter family protein n=1 Tax=Allosphingosinicella indica TaxID=941907 RepID=A0A1X7G398_9SPHN|nr:DMT family transporter [Allosphingosinicella indica]SMF63096.1 EamA-like transporter family protein [Allosphingosinicella indica]